jgi:hypothetical protein
MDATLCPVCNLCHVSKRMDGFRECPECGLILTEENLATAHVTRDRLIAEAVKPWREVLETLTDARRERCMEICQPADADFDCCVICTNRPCLSARALLFQSESVKANNEETK